MCLIMQFREKISSMLEGAGQKGEGSAIPDYTRIEPKLLPGSGNEKSLDMLATTRPHKPVWYGQAGFWVACSPLAMARLLSLLQLYPFFFFLTQLPYPHGPQDPVLISVQFMCRCG